VSVSIEETIEKKKLVGLDSIPSVVLLVETIKITKIEYDRFTSLLILITFDSSAATSGM